VSALPCVVSTDLDRYLADCDRADAKDRAINKKADELSEALHGRIYVNGERGVVALCDEDGATITDAFLDEIANPVTWIRDQIRERAIKILSN
jgi:hypothetical protein